MPEQTVCLPLLPMRGMVVFPAMMVNLDVGRERSVAALEQAMLADRKILLVAQRDDEKEEIGQEDLYEVGTVAEVRRSMKMPDGSVRILVEGLSRATITECHSLEKYAEAIAFDAAPFQLKVKAVHVVAPQDARIVQLSIDGVVQRGLKLAAPTIEAVVQQLDACRV